MCGISVSSRICSFRNSAPSDGRYPVLTMPKKTALASALRPERGISFSSIQTVEKGGRVTFAPALKANPDNGSERFNLFIVFMVRKMFVM